MTGQPQPITPSPRTLPLSTMDTVRPTIPSPPTPRSSLSASVAVSQAPIKNECRTGFGVRGLSGWPYLLRAKSVSFSFLLYVREEETFLQSRWKDRKKKEKPSRGGTERTNSGKEELTVSSHQPLSPSHPPVRSPKHCQTCSPHRCRRCNVVQASISLHRAVDSRASDDRRKKLMTEFVVARASVSLRG
jgi:hypothetical protein